MGCASIWMHHWLDWCHGAIHWQNHLNRDTKQFGFDSWLFLHSFWKHNSKSLVCGGNIHSISAEKHCHLWLRSDEWAGISEAGTEPNSVGLDNPPPPLSSSFPLTWFQSQSQHEGTRVSETGRWKEKGWLDYDTPQHVHCPAAGWSSEFHKSSSVEVWRHNPNNDSDDLSRQTFSGPSATEGTKVCHCPLGGQHTKHLLGTASKSTVALFSYTTTIHSNT